MRTATYKFNNLAAGTYSVIEVQPAGWLDGKDTPGNSGGVADVSPPGDRISQIVLAWGVDGVEYNFGELLPGSIAGSVVICETDTTIPNVQIDLLDGDGKLVSTTKTDENGNYIFTGLRPGEYSIHEHQPAGYYDHDAYIGSGDGVVVDPNDIDDVHVASDQHLVDYVFCELPPGSISGRVHADTGPDCDFDNPDILLEGVTMDLLDADGNFIRSTTTDKNGEYHFTDLAPGVYQVREHQPTIPAGRARSRAGVLAGVLVLGWFSSLGTMGPDRGRAAIAASGPVTGRTVAGRSGGTGGPAVVRRSGHTPGRGTQPPGRTPGRASTPGAPESQAGARKSSRQGLQGLAGARQASRRAAGMPVFLDVPPRWLPPSPRTRHRRAAAPAVDCHRVKCVALTFDDGPGPYTLRLLSTLARHHGARVTFFLIGRNIGGREGIVRQEIAAGERRRRPHLGSRRPPVPVQTRDPLAAQPDDRRDQPGDRRAGADHEAAVRGDRRASRQGGQVARARADPLGVDTNDWRDRNSAIVAHRAISRAHRGDIILMHDIHPTTVNAVPKILRRSRRTRFHLRHGSGTARRAPPQPGNAYYDGR